MEDGKLLERLRLLKFQKDFTLRWLSNEIGTSEDVVGNYFNGKTRIPVKVLKRIADILKIGTYIH